MLTHLSHPAPRRPARRAFTLIEIMVTVGIIVVLIGILVAVGTQVKHTAQNNATKATLEILRGSMSDYLKSNAEPNTLPPSTLLSPTVWLPALKSDPNIANNLKAIQGYTTSSTTVQDGFGFTIMYVPAVKGTNGLITTPGYFVSPGPDGAMGTFGANPSDPLTGDNILSGPVAP